jgi:PAS domain S-box-containing protein
MKNLISDTNAVHNLKTTTKLFKESLNDFFKLFDSSPSAMAITDIRKLKFVKVNEKFVEFFGYKKKEVIGRTAIDISIHDKTEFNRILKFLKENQGFQNQIFKGRTKDGRAVYLIASSEVMEINGEKYSVSSFLDITEIKEQQIVIERQNKEIFDSINYARLIQKAIFPSKKQLEDAFPKSFVLAKPKHIVSGDFHWIEKHKNKVFIAVSDCTGHGVPSAFLSIIGYKLLSKFIFEYGFSSPAEFLNQLNNEFFVSDKQIIESVFEIKDGLDIALCVVDKSKMTMMYAGAYNPVYQIRKGKFTKLSVDKIPIHLFTKQTREKFTNHEIKIEKDDIYYMFSDGYASQFGGTKGKRFMHNNLKELILSMQHLTMSEQREIINNSIEEWDNTLGVEQINDILILGFKIL